MFPSRDSLPLGLVLLGLLLTAGCMTGQNPSGNGGTLHANGIAVPGPGYAGNLESRHIINIATPSPPGDRSSRYWINFDPISDIQPGDTVTINATTNLPVGTDIGVMVYDYYLPDGAPHDYGTAVVVIPGEGFNQISFMINTSQAGLDTRSYLVEDFTFLPAYNYTHAYARFNISNCGTPP